MATASYVVPEPMDQVESPALEMRWIRTGDRLQARWYAKPQAHRRPPVGSEGKPRLTVIRSRAGAFTTRSHWLVAVLGWFLVVLL